MKLVIEPEMLATIHAVLIMADTKKSLQISEKINSQVDNPEYFRLVIKQITRIEKSSYEKCIGE